MKYFDIPDSKISDINIIIIILPHANFGWILSVSAWFHRNALLGNHLPKWSEKLGAQPGQLYTTCMSSRKRLQTIMAA